MADGHVCQPVVDEAGNVIGHALGALDLDERGRRALAEVVQAAIRHVEAKDAADPEAAAERARRQKASRARNAERLRRVRGEG